MKTILLIFAALALISPLRAADDARLAKVTAADDARIAATKAADQSKLADLFSDELRYAHSSGSVDDKTSLIAALTSGRTKYVGLDYEERREVLGRLGQVYLVIEGGPGTEHEVRVARGRGAAVIPVARSGGHAADVYPLVEPVPGAGSPDWELLQDRAAPLEAVISAVRRLVETSFSAAGRANRCVRPGLLGRLSEWFHRLRRPRRLN